MKLEAENFLVQTAQSHYEREIAWYKITIYTNNNVWTGGVLNMFVVISS